MRDAVRSKERWKGGRAPTQDPGTDSGRVTPALPFGAREMSAHCKDHNDVSDGPRGGAGASAVREVQGGAAIGAGLGLGLGRPLGRLLA